MELTLFLEHVNGKTLMHTRTIVKVLILPHIPKLSFVNHAELMDVGSKWFYALFHINLIKIFLGKGNGATQYGPIALLIVSPLMIQTISRIL